MAFVAVTLAKTGPPALSTVTITLRCLSVSAIPSATDLPRATAWLSLA